MIGLSCVIFLSTIIFLNYFLNSSPKDMFIDFRERGKGRQGVGVGREREKHGCERETSIASCMHPSWGPYPQPRYVPRPGIKPTDFSVCGMTLQPTEPPSQGIWLTVTHSFPVRGLFSPILAPPPGRWECSSHHHCQTWLAVALTIEKGEKV